jgi:hypothetical protein
MSTLTVTLPALGLSGAMIAAVSPRSSGFAGIGPGRDAGVRG